MATSVTNSNVISGTPKKGTELVSLEVKAQIADGALRVEYALTNNGSQAIVAYDGATGKGVGEHRDLTGQCYISFDGDRSARILRIRSPAHPTKAETHTFMPAVSVTEPGATRSVKFQLSLPVKERSQFSPDFPGATYQSRAIQRLELRIGYFWKTAATLLEPYPNPNVWRVTKGAALADTREIAAVTPLTFELLVRTDPTFIRM